MDTDPFADPIFATRMQKLLAMLASEQPGEADAARRKLIEHLATHRLSFTDMAMRLADRTPKPSFVQGAREMTLDRQLGIARQARQEAEQDAAKARARADELQLALQRANFDVGRALQTRSQIQSRAALAWGVAAICLVIAAIPYASRLLHRPDQTTVAPGGALAGRESEARQAPAQETVGNVTVLRVGPGERLGTVLVQDLAVRLTPNDNAGVRSFLNQGMRVIIQQQVRVGAESWLQIRSVTGSGWVRSSDVLH